MESKIISGLIDSVAGVLHLTNQWTSLVMTFNPLKIPYGDSLGGSMPLQKASSFQRWICHMLWRSGIKMLQSDIPICPLMTTIQENYNSCGLFALNAIRHHYLPQDFPLLQSDYLLVVCYRLEIALGLLSESTVSTYYKKHLSQL